MKIGLRTIILFSLIIRRFIKCMLISTIMNEYTTLKYEVNRWMDEIIKF